MDDHHHQPIWPMIQGAANYAWNLIEEAWNMLWMAANTAREQMIGHQGDSAHHDSEMQEVLRNIATPRDTEHNSAKDISGEAQKCA